VEDFLAGAVDGGAGAELQQAAGVGGNDGLGRGWIGRGAFFRRVVRGMFLFA